MKQENYDDIHRQNVQKARAMARMMIYDRLGKLHRDIFKSRALPVEPSEDQICAVVEQHGGYFDDNGRLIIPLATFR